ncbi:MAG: transcriptional regulator NrdR [Pseudobdellovibrio sp.]|uniref:transcriptional regulator NrdR n=1 Tax=Pseudobdellovibrio sp. HCB154 TaxID=3386277 RepID=UPI00391758C9|nr:transcriptional regulator NrdR [Pseudobdellovibrio sp.]
MKCPFCGHSEDKVLDTRVQKDGGIRRRRECLSCKSRYSTLETVVLSYPFVIKKDGRREPFSKEKLLRGLSYACNKRPVSTAALDAIVERIASWVITRGEGEISARVIGRRVMAELKQLDDVAYVRFASVYKTFKDVQDFVEKLEGDELIDMIDSSGPQLSLTTQLQPQLKPVNNTDQTTKEANDEKTIKRTRTPDPIPN